MPTYSWDLIDSVSSPTVQDAPAIAPGSDVARDLLLGDDGDLVIVSGDLQLSSGASALTQACDIALQFFKGEWFYDLEAGVPYFQSILVKSPNPDLLESIFRKAILDVKGITAVISISFLFDPVERSLAVSWSATSDLGLLASTVGV